MPHFLKVFYKEILLVFFASVSMTALVIITTLTYRGVGPELVLGIVKLILIPLLALPLSIALTRVVRIKKLSRVIEVGLFGIILALVSLIIITLRLSAMDIGGYEASRIVTIGLISIMLMFALPAVVTKNRIKAWHKMVIMLQAAMVSNLLSVGLFVGLALAVSFVGLLFPEIAMVVNSTVIGLVAIFTLVTLNCTVFLYILDRNLRLNKGKDIPIDREFSKIIKFIGIPLYLLYTLIIYVYLLAITLSGVIPNGRLAGLCLISIFTGFAVILVLYPQRLQKDKFSWAYFLFFVVNLVPITAVYLYSILVRIFEFGLTPDRILGLLIGICWIILIAYIPFRKVFRLDVYLAISAALIGAAYFIPGLNVNNLAGANQTVRVIQKLEQEGIIKDGKLYRQYRVINCRTESELREELTLIHSNFGPDFIKPYVSAEEFQQLSNTNTYYYRFANDLMNLANVDCDYYFDNGSHRGGG